MIIEDKYRGKRILRMERLSAVTMIGVVMILMTTIAGLTLISYTIVSAQGQPTSVSIVQGASNQNNGKFFEPPDVNIKTGDTVKWTNNDITVHTVTAGTPGQGPNQQFDSGILNPKASFDFKFDQAGEYDYYCTIHPWMIGKVIVT